MNCKQCGYELDRNEIAKMVRGKPPYDFANPPSDWQVDPESCDWYCGDCARSFDGDVPDDWEVYYLG